MLNEEIITPIICFIVAAILLFGALSMHVIHL